MAYVCILMGDGHSCDFFLKKALELSETQGNLLEKCWLNMSKVRTSSHQATVCAGVMYVVPAATRRLCVLVLCMWGAHPSEEAAEITSWLGFRRHGKSLS